MRGFLWALASLPAAMVGTAGMGEASGPALPCIVAHRGRVDPAQPENSLRTMRHTIALGVPMVEMDLQADSDGTLYLQHDDLLGRTTTGEGPLAALDDRQAAALRLKAGTGEPTSEGLVRFEAVARWAAETPTARLMLDIKKVPPAQVASIVRRYGLIDRVLVLTFDPATAQAAFAADTDWRVSVLVPDAAALDRYRKAAGAHSMAAYIPTFSPVPLFEAAHAGGIPIVTDAVMPSPGGSLDSHAMQDGPQVYASYLAGRHVDVFVTDHARRVLASR